MPYGGSVSTMPMLREGMRSMACSKSPAMSLGGGSSRNPLNVSYLSAHMVASVSPGTEKAAPKDGPLPVSVFGCPYPHAAMAMSPSASALMA